MRELVEGGFFVQVEKAWLEASFKQGYTFASISGDSIRDSTLFMSLIVCSASVRVRIYQGSALQSHLPDQVVTYGMW